MAVALRFLGLRSRVPPATWMHLPLRPRPLEAPPHTCCEMHQDRRLGMLLRAPKHTLWHATRAQRGAARLPAPTAACLRSPLACRRCCRLHTPPLRARAAAIHQRRCHFGGLRFWPACLPAFQRQRIDVGISCGAVGCAAARALPAWPQPFVFLGVARRGARGKPNYSSNNA